MPKKKVTQYNVAQYQPDELNALKELVKEFVNKIETIDNEIELLKTDRKELCEEYSEKLDLKTLNAALKVVKIKQNVAHLDTYELFESVLEPKPGEG